MVNTKPRPEDEIKNWKVYDFDKWSVKYPPSLEECGNTEGIPLCEVDARSKGVIFWFTGWSYEEVDEFGDTPFGSCGKNFQECKKFFFDFYQTYKIRERTVNDIRGVEFDGTAKRTGSREVKFIAEFNTGDGILDIYQTNFSQVFNEFYEKILLTIKLKESPSQSQPPKKEATRLTVEFQDQYGLPVNPPNGCAVALFYDGCVLLDAAGEKIPGGFVTVKKSVFEFQHEIPQGRYTLIFNVWPSNSENGNVERYYSPDAQSPIEISNDRDLYKKITIHQDQVKYGRVEIYAKIANQFNTPLGGVAVYLTNEKGNGVAATYASSAYSTSYSVMWSPTDDIRYASNDRVQILPGNYFLNIQKDGYSPFKKQIYLPDVSNVPDDINMGVIDLGSIILSKP